MHGYAEFLEAIADADHPDHASMLQWSGGAYDPNAFDPRAVVFGRSAEALEEGLPTMTRDRASRHRPAPAGFKRGAAAKEDA